MATATCKTVGGVLSASTYIHNATSFAKTVGGVVSATGKVAWAGTNAAQKYVNWLPNASTPVLDANGRMNPVWYKFLKEIADNRLGGVSAPTVTQVVDTQTQVQAQITATDTVVQASIVQSNAIATAVNTQTAVSQQNNLSGANQIPKAPTLSTRELVR